MGFLLAPLIGLLTFGCVSPARNILAPQSLQGTLSALAKEHHVCAVALAVIKNRKLDSIRYATACSPASMLGSHGVFQAASLSKPVFAYAVLQLVAQGKMALDEPVMKYLPKGYWHQPHPWKAKTSHPVTDPRLHAITVRMALNHTSGLPNWASGRLDFESHPGAKWNYSGEGYVLLQRAIEAITGQPLHQFMVSQVFKRLAMEDSNYVWSEGIARTLVPGTKANGAPRATMDLRTPNAAFSLYTTAADYGNFLVNVLNDDGLLKHIIASPVAVDPKLGLSWGLGWGIERDGKDSYIWQWGNNTGYRAFVIASVQTGDGFVMLTNGENGLKLAKPLTRVILPGERKLFQSPILGGDIVTSVCTTLRLCF